MDAAVWLRNFSLTSRAVTLGTPMSVVRENMSASMESASSKARSAPPPAPAPPAPTPAPELTPAPTAPAPAPAPIPAPTPAPAPVPAPVDDTAASLGFLLGSIDPRECVAERGGASAFLF